MAPPKLAEGLTLAVSTLGGRISSITLPEPRNGLQVLILWQEPGDVPPALLRDDVTVVPLESRGLSLSRNAALEHAQTAFLQFWDDDLTPDWAGLETLWTHLKANPKLSFVTGRRRGVDRGPLAKTGFALTRRNTARTATPEIMVRLADVRQEGVTFDPRFGLGAPHPLGEEFIFLTDLLARDLRGWHLPVEIGDHPPESTGDTWADPTLLTARATVLARVFGAGAFAAGTAFAWKNRSRLGLGPALRFPWMCLGARP